MMFAKRRNRNAMREITVQWSICVMVGLSAGCALQPLPSPPPSTSAPFFSPTSEDAVQVATLASELDEMAMDCAAAEACEDQVHFSRALVSLFENREAARASFQQVVTLHPSSPFAASSALWLQLLNDQAMSSSSSDPHRRILTEITAQWAREWMARQLSLRIPSGKTVGNLKPAHVKTLSKQVRERDQRIAELRAQLDALKVIDQDQQDRHRKVKAPASVLPGTEMLQK